MKQYLEEQEFEPMPDTYYEYLEEKEEGLGQKKHVCWRIPLQQSELFLLYIKHLMIDDR
ncbi:MAG: hypothetical protein OXR66_07590 [Candidatus Woesearchaeota archaeon]|nr:hypothetical protein [Candidatus Woesearchaeota archaeon]